MIRVLLYLTVIVIANVVTAALPPFKLLIFLVPMGTFFIGFTFILRDLVQMKYGRKQTYIFIIVALTLSAITSSLLGDSLMIVTASAISFLVSETTDTEIFSRLNKSISTRVLVSGIVGGILDSSVFVIVGLSPIGAGFISWDLVPMAILGQIIVKTAIQGLGAAVWRIKQ